MAILLVRHAQSEANLDESLFQTVADHAIALSPKGHDQAAKVGQFVENYFSVVNPENKPVRLWASPYLRTTQTAIGLRDNAPQVNWDVSVRDENIFFDDRLREREFGYFDGLNDDEIAEHYPKEWDHYQKIRLAQGNYYARPFGGESGADVANRLRTFKETLWRDLAKGKEHHVIVNHGFTLRCFVTAFLNLHPTIFANERNPANTAVRLLDTDSVTGNYADYGYVYDPDKAIFLNEKPTNPVEHKLVL